MTKFTSIENLKKETMRLLVLAFGIALLGCQTKVKENETSAKFIQVKGTSFMKDEKPYYFIGANFWYGMNLGASDSTGNRERLIRELDDLKALGITNLRIMGGSEGPDSEPYRSKPSLQTAPGEYNQAVLDGLDFLLDEMGKREMTAVVCLNNFWAWSGGMCQYLAWASGVKIPYHPPAEGGTWNGFQEFSSQFYSNEKATKLFDDHINFIVNRKNPINGKLYKEDPTIMSWQLGNEPRGNQNVKDYQTWINKTTGFIKSLDTNHLVSIGSEGATSSTFSGTNFWEDHQSQNVDYTTIHVWVENWQWYNPAQDSATIDSAMIKAKNYITTHLEQSQKMNKPMVIEEFGIARDKGDYAHTGTTKYRDLYYKMFFEEVYTSAQAKGVLSGCNFWAWGGEGRPRKPFDLWNVGDDMVGDPPHEGQGWYSVYNTDTNTKAVISDYTSKINAIK